MNLRAARLTLRPRDTADVLDLAAPFCLTNWRLFLPLGVLMLPSLVACWAARSWLHWQWPAVWILAVGLGGVCQAPFTIACGEVLFQGPEQIVFNSLSRRLVRRLPAFLTVHILSRLLLLVAATFLIPLPFVASSFFVVHEAVLLEGFGPLAAFGRSRRAVRGHGASVAMTALALVLLPIFGVVAGELTGSTLVELVFQMGRPFGSLWTDGGSPYALIGFFLTIPLVSAARFLKYVDLRTRKEGWDIQLRFMAIAASAEGETAQRSVSTTEAA
ncbi:MAG: hypothetical protein QOI66_5211 [Myxococcales bacterium]|jgi:hypothetical protein|nr:hypothetical protein [Myxococcales bacterium]